MINFAPLQLKTYKLVGQMFVRQGKKMAFWGVPAGLFGNYAYVYIFFGSRVPYRALSVCAQAPGSPGPL